MQRRRKLLRKASAKSQSAMEYLMTYGWAILIIAVVLAALFELGVFNPMTFAPKASPGSCQVVRPEGAGTTSFISLEGECNGELPQYAAYFNGNAYVNVPSSSSLNPVTTGITISYWVEPSSISSEQINTCMWRAIVGPNPFSGGYLSWLDGCNNEVSGLVYVSGTRYNAPSYDSLNYNQWYHVVEVAQTGSYLILYVNGQAVGSPGTPLPSGNIGTNNNMVNIGGNQGGNAAGGWFYGYLSNVQIYNTSLSPSEIQALYQEGIGGAPIDLQNLIAWWPLNGNAKDYSGNDNNGVPNGVTYTSNWYSGYSAP